MQYRIVACGGTFDHFHKGHESFLKYVFSVGRKIIVGVTSDNYILNSKSETRNPKLIEPFEERKDAVLEFVKREGVLSRAAIIKIDDLFGPTLDESLMIDALVFSEETKKGAEIINERRKELGLKELNLLIAPEVLAEDGKLISSGRIRQGEINREGKLYVNPLWLKENLILPESLRGEFKKPFGVLSAGVTALQNLGIVATVGDVTTKKFNEFKLNQHVSAIDFKVERQKKFSDIAELGFLGSERTLNIVNPAGSITSDLFKVCLTAWGQKERMILFIEGEDDLAVLPLILTAPLGAVIFYGQPHEGLVRVQISEEIKGRAHALCMRFTPIQSGFTTRGH